MYVGVSICLCICVCLSLCLFVSVLCVSVFLCVKVLKEELKFVFFSKQLKINELDAFEKHINTSSTKRIHGTVYLSAYCAWGKSANVKNL